MRLTPRKFIPDFIPGVPDDIGKISNRSKSGRRAKTKGSSFERKVGKLLGDWWESKFFRTPMSGGSQLKFDYNLAGDLCTPAEDFPFHVECKNQEALGGLHTFLVSRKAAVWGWWDQCTQECPQGQIPWLIFTKNYVPIFSMVDQSFYDCVNPLSSNCGDGSIESTALIYVNGVVVQTLDTFLLVSKEVIKNAAGRHQEYYEESRKAIA